MTALPTHLVDTPAGRLAPGLYRTAFASPSPSSRPAELEVELGNGHYYHVPLLIGPLQ